MITSLELQSPAPPDLALTQYTAEVWCAQLDYPFSVVQELWKLLSCDERLRAIRFHYSRERHRFIVRRALLRIIIGHYLQQPPDQIRFHYGAHGKPALAQEWDTHELRFNLSHSGDVAMYALTCGREVGVDVERLRSDLDHDGIVERFFSPLEIAEFRRLPRNLKVQGFFNCWTRKEAYVKACGTGFCAPLDRFSVTLTPGIAAQLRESAGAPEHTEDWSMGALMPRRGYVAAVAVAGPCDRIAFRYWPEFK